MKKFLDCISVVGSTPSRFQGTKKYVSTGAVATTEIDESEVVEVSYEERPSRANLTAEAGDILFAKMQGTRKTLLLDSETEENIYSTGFYAVRANPEVITTECLYYLVDSELFLAQKDKHCSGATQKAITNGGLAKIEIRVPPLSKQGALTEKLRCLTQLIADKRKQLELFDEVIKSRFIEMFGDVITNTKGWKQYIFSEIATSRLGKMLDAKQQTGNSSFPYLANFNVQWFRFDLTSLNEMDFDEEDRVEFELKEGDLLVCEGGEIGRCAVWHNDMQPCYFQKALHRVRCNTEVINPNYMAWWFKYNCDHNGFAAIEGAKATIAHLPGAKLKLLRVTTPPIELQNEFASFIEQIDKSKFEIQQSLEKLEILKKSLMQQYFG